MFVLTVDRKLIQGTASHNRGQKYFDTIVSEYVKAILRCLSHDALDFWLLANDQKIQALLVVADLKTRLHAGLLTFYNVSKGFTPLSCMTQLINYLIRQNPTILGRNPNRSDLNRIIFYTGSTFRRNSGYLRCLGHTWQKTAT